MVNVVKYKKYLKRKQKKEERGLILNNIVGDNEHKI
jgi:hypothetical protein